MLSTIIFDLSIAIVLGIILGCIFFIAKSAKISITTEEVDWRRMDLPYSEAGTDWAVIYITGPLFFMSANQLKKELDQAISRKGIIFSLRGVPSIDLTARDIFADYLSVARLNDQRVIFTSMQPEVKAQLKQIWEKDAHSPVHHPTVAHALTTLHQEF